MLKSSFLFSRGRNRGAAVESRNLFLSYSCYSMNHFLVDRSVGHHLIKSILFLSFLSRVLHDSTPRLCRSVRRSVSLSVRPPVTLNFCGFWPHCSCPNNRVISILTPAYPQATEIAVYPALFFHFLDITATIIFS